MILKKARAIWELMRLEHGFMLFLAIFIGSIISQRTLLDSVLPPLDKVILTFFTALFLEASTFALNDYYDLPIDKINKRTDRPLVRGDIKPQTALYLFYILFPLGLLCSFFVNMTCFIIATVTAFLSVLYDAKMKKIKLIGNFYIAYIMSIPFVFGGATVLEYSSISLSGINPAIYTIALIAFLAGSGREIMKDVMDFEGDRKIGVRSLPRYIGKRKSNTIAAIFYVSAIVLSFFPYISESFAFYYKNNFYLGLVLLTDIILIYVSLHLILKKSPKMKLFRKLSLISIFIGLIAFLLGSFIII